VLGLDLSYGCHFLLIRSVGCNKRLINPKRRHASRKVE
jgi:hypothetical protein